MGFSNNKLDKRDALFILRSLGEIPSYEDPSFARKYLLRLHTSYSWEEISYFISRTLDTKIIVSHNVKNFAIKRSSSQLINFAVWEIIKLLTNQ